MSRFELKSSVVKAFNAVYLVRVANDGAEGSVAQEDLGYDPHVSAERSTICLCSTNCLFVRS